MKDKIRGLDIVLKGNTLNVNSTKFDSDVNFSKPLNEVSKKTCRKKNTD